MSYIPNIRDKFGATRFDKNTDGNKINPYWQGFLDDKGVETLKAYDGACDIVRNFFENLDVYRDDFQELVENYKDATGKTAAVSFPDDYGETEDDVVNAPVFNKDKIITAEELKETPFQALLLRTIYECLMDWMEMSRNEIGVSILDSIPEDQYEKLQDKVLSGRRCHEYTDYDAAM